jgi:hypothetical protein
MASAASPGSGTRLSATGELEQSRCLFVRKLAPASTSGSVIGNVCPVATLPTTTRSDAMPIPGFPAEAIDENGFPRWITQLGDEYANHLLHVVRGLSPEEALRLVGGGKVYRYVAPGTLPTEPTKDGSGLIHAAIGVDRRVDLLLAGRNGDWTFVYDAGGATFEVVDVLSADGRVAVSATSSINADSSLEYAEDGQTLVEIREPYGPRYAEEFREALHSAVEAAGSVDSADEDFWDIDVNVRIACALAGLTWTLEELAAQPLIVGQNVTTDLVDHFGQFRG